MPGIHANIQKISQAADYEAFIDQLSQQGIVNEKLRNDKDEVTKIFIEYISQYPLHEDDCDSLRKLSRRFSKDHPQLSEEIKKKIDTVKDSSFLSEEAPLLVQQEILLNLELHQLVAMQVEPVSKRIYKAGSSNLVWVEVAKRIGIPTTGQKWKEGELKSYVLHEIDHIKQTAKVNSKTRIDPSPCIEKMLNEELTYENINIIKDWLIARDTLISWTYFSEEIKKTDELYEPEHLFESDELEKMQHECGVIGDKFHEWFHNNLDDLNRVMTLNLYNEDLYSLPNEIGELTGIRIVNLGHNRFNKIPACIYKMKELTHLNFINNRIKSVEKDIGMFSDLEELNLGKNMIDEIPDTIGNLQKLDTLRLDDNKIKGLNVNVSKLIELKMLYINNNLIEDIPEWIVNLDKLEQLDISGNKINELLPSLGKLSQLSWIDASNNSIEEIPDEFCRLKNLRYLYLSKNKIKELNPLIGGLENLKCIGLNSNSLNVLPEEISKLTKLKKLHLNDNRILYFPECIFSLINLNFLDLSGNGLFRISRDIGKLKNLKELRLTHNQLTEVSGFISDLENLEELYLDRNLLKQLPDRIGKLRNIKTLNLSSNPLVALPYKFFEDVDGNIRRLFLSKDQMDIVPEKFQFRPGRFFALYADDYKDSPPYHPYRF